MVGEHGLASSKQENNTIHKLVHLQISTEIHTIYFCAMFPIILVLMVVYGAIVSIASMLCIFAIVFHLHAICTNLCTAHEAGDDAEAGNGG